MSSATVMRHLFSQRITTEGHLPPSLHLFVRAQPRLALNRILHHGVVLFEKIAEEVLPGTATSLGLLQHLDSLRRSHCTSKIFCSNSSRERPSVGSRRYMMASFLLWEFLRRLMEEDGERYPFFPIKADGRVCHEGAPVIRGPFIV